MQWGAGRDLLCLTPLVVISLVFLVNVTINIKLPIRTVSETFRTHQNVALLQFVFLNSNTAIYVVTVE